MIFSYDLLHLFFQKYSCSLLVAQVMLHWHFDCVNTEDESKFNLVMYCVFIKSDFIDNNGTKRNLACHGCTESVCQILAAVLVVETE